MTAVTHVMAVTSNRVSAGRFDIIATSVSLSFPPVPPLRASEGNVCAELNQASFDDRRRHQPPRTIHVGPRQDRAAVEDVVNVDVTVGPHAPRNRQALADARAG